MSNQGGTVAGEMRGLAEHVEKRIGQALSAIGDYLRPLWGPSTPPSTGPQPLTLPSLTEVPTVCNPAPLDDLMDGRGSDFTEAEKAEALAAYQGGRR